MAKKKTDEQVARPQRKWGGLLLKIVIKIGRASCRERV